LRWLGGQPYDLRMPITRTLLTVAYAAIALLALLATWHQNLAYFGSAPGGPFGNFVGFWRETLATRPSASITLDLFLLGWAATIWMVAEARRLDIRFVWLFVLAGVMIAISVSFPLFLIARERRLAAAGAAPRAAVLSRGDLGGLAAFSVLNLVLSLWSLTT
jgi:hypothetical protein